MKRQHQQKLDLNRETIRTLGAHEIRKVAAGAPDDGDTVFCTNAVCATDACPTERCASNGCP